jgi:transcriptional regulator with XRE-family HTH domain
VSVVIQAERLRAEMVRRGLSARELARAAGVSAPTVGTALAGRPIATRSLQLIAETLGRIPPLAVVDALLDSSTPGIGE